MQEVNIDRLKLVRDDAESDAKSLDGRAVTGAVLGEMLGNICAMVYAICAVLLDEAEEAD